MTDREEWLNGVLKHYADNDIRPGDPEEGIWEDAHAPLPKCLGGDITIPLLREHHIIHDLFQSEEFEHMCFYSAEVLKVLGSKWFKTLPWELQKDCWQLYRKWVSSGTSIGGRKAAELGVGIHAPGKQSEAGKKSCAQVWISTADGFVSNSACVAYHNKFIGADPNERVQVPDEIVPMMKRLPKAFSKMNEAELAKAKIEMAINLEIWRNHNIQL